MIFRWLGNVLIWLDIGVNVLLLGGSPYETLSSRIGKRSDNGDRWACVICKWMDKVDARHCSTAQVDDRGKTLPNWWRKK